MQLSTELSAQASQLAVHQHQLARLTSLTEDLVRLLQGLNLQPSTPPVAPHPTPGHPPETPPAIVNPRLAFPGKVRWGIQQV